MVTVVALRDFMWNGQEVHGGEAIDLSPIDASVQAFAHNVSLDPQARPTYLTRELTPAPASVVVVEVVSDPPKKRRGRPRKAKA